MAKRFPPGHSDLINDYMYLLPLLAALDEMAETTDQDELMVLADDVAVMGEFILSASELAQVTALRTAVCETTARRHLHLVR